MLVIPSEARNLGFAGSYENPISISMPQNNSGPDYSVPFLIFLDPRLHDLFHQCIRQRFIGRELNGPLGGPIALQFLLKPVEHTGPSWEQAAMVLERRVAHEHSSELEHRDPVADDLGGLRRHHRPNHRANMFQCALSRLRCILEVLIYSLRSNFASHLLLHTGTDVGSSRPSGAPF